MDRDVSGLSHQTKERKVNHPSCSDCKYLSVSFHLNPTSGGGFCRRFPAQIVHVGDEILATFPWMSADEWCGEFQREREPSSFKPSSRRMRLVKKA